ncbi:ATPase family AAA domain-containing protein 3B 3 [Colletotrichum chlorophyti]|uniref:ATPase family AAA domain-containing protein 3B 3 n=1 Tax=Colletotrichum chlorophyti TaxID=708187 RepID=A0A1Q8RPZ3_9PEZI|nr:ATPase family AAA domain-containing protein 3B 3 [Colletotrichum chlorophyti]
MSSPLPAAGSRREFRAYHVSLKKDGKKSIERIPDPFGKTSSGRANDDKDSSYALVITRDFTGEDPYEPKSTTLKVNSPHILKAFRDVVGSYPTVASDFKSPVQLTSPYQMLIHYWEELEHYHENTEDDNQRLHTGLLFDFMHSEVGAQRSVILSMLETQQITFPTAWVIFRPGTLLYEDIMGFPWLLECQKTAYEQNAGGPYLEVICKYTDYNGTIAGEASHTTRIYQKELFGGDSPAVITDMPIYPWSFVKNHKELQPEIEKRGRRFLSYVDMSIEAYEGLAQYLKLPPWAWYNPDMAFTRDVWLPYTESGRVIIDRKTFQKDHYKSTKGVQKALNPSPLLCPPYVLGFSLGRKCWCRFFIDRIKKVEWNTHVWDSLILPDDQKRVIRALVTSHHYPEDPRNQPEQKGKGLVILLHGSPGSGKTLTAEVAAEGMERALISASLGDLNKDQNFEHELQKTMQYATQWRAVLLLDEADVFLETREEKPGNADRNALVAVFLKHLEYFSGVVFLTTNRLASLDGAMNSRIHLALGFSTPGFETRRRLWMKCIQSIPDAEASIEDLDDAVEDIVAHVLNGREISNAVNTARTLARFDGERLQMKHIEQVLKVKLDFQKALSSENKRLTLAQSGGALVRTGSIVDESEKYLS